MVRVFDEDHGRRPVPFVLVSMESVALIPKQDFKAAVEGDTKELLAKAEK